MQSWALSHILAGHAITQGRRDRLPMCKLDRLGRFYSIFPKLVGWKKNIQVIFELKNIGAFCVIQFYFVYTVYVVTTTIYFIKKKLEPNCRDLLLIIATTTILPIRCSYRLVVWYTDQLAHKHILWYVPKTVTMP